MVALTRMNQEGGFDCPGCAWPDPHERSGMAEYCENGVKAFASESTRRRVTPEFFAEHSIGDLAEQSDYWLNDQGRITHPMVLREGADRYAPISWSAAFRLVGEELQKLSSPDEAIFYTSGRTSNEAAFLYQMFVRAYGTNNLPDCSNMCHESSGTALNEVIGVGKGTVLLEDFELADTIVVVGQNPGTNHPRMLSTLQAAKLRGCTIIHINPLREAGLVRFKHPQRPGDLFGLGTELADRFLQVRVNGDVALLKGLMKALVEAEDREPGTVLDTEFILVHTSGFGEFLDDLRRESWDSIEMGSGLPRVEMIALVPFFAAPRKTIICWAMGLTQHVNAVANVQSCVNLLLMNGSIGKPGAGACPVRGHSNVQGDRTMGIWDKPPRAFLDALRTAAGFEPPRKPGYDTVESIEAMRDGRASVFVALGGNFLSASPDTALTATSLRKCALTVQISTTLNRSHLVTGRSALILPCLGRTERDIQNGEPQFVTVENSMGVVHASAGTREPASPNLMSEPAIVAGMASAALGRGGVVDWDGLGSEYNRIRDLIEKVVPGFESFNERIGRHGKFVLPNPVRFGVFATRTGNAVFTVHPIPDPRSEPGRFTMMTIRSHDQFNTTIYGLHDRYRGLKGRRRVVMMNIEDIAAATLSEGQHVDLKSHHNDEIRIAKDFVVVPYDIPRGSVATYFPEANVLVPIDLTAEGSNTPASKSVPITIEPATTATS
jgi:molybdopterin-dependent oxidoreductase alpha subunit